MIFQSLQEFEAEANKQRTLSEQTIASLQQQVKHFYHSLITLCFESIASLQQRVIKIKHP